MQLIVRFSGTARATGATNPSPEGHYEIMGRVCLSVRLSVCLSRACLELNRESLGCPKLARWKPIS